MRLAYSVAYTHAREHATKFYNLGNRSTCASQQLKQFLFFIQSLFKINWILFRCLRQFHRFFSHNSWPKFDTFLLIVSAYVCKCVLQWSRNNERNNKNRLNDDKNSNFHLRNNLSNQSSVANSKRYIYVHDVNNPYSNSNSSQRTKNKNCRNGTSDQNRCRVWHSPGRFVVLPEAEETKRNRETEEGGQAKVINRMNSRMSSSSCEEWGHNVWNVFLWYPICLPECNRTRTLRQLNIFVQRSADMPVCVCVCCVIAHEIIKICLVRSQSKVNLFQLIDRVIVAFKRFQIEIDVDGKMDWMELRGNRFAAEHKSMLIRL